MLDTLVYVEFTESTISTFFKVHCFWRFFSIPSSIRKPQPGHPPVGPCLILMHNAHEDLIKCKYYIWFSDLFSRSYFAQLGALSHRGAPLAC